MAAASDSVDDIDAIICLRQRRCAGVQVRQYRHRAKATRALR
jgi:hypothetical protein